MEAAGSRARLKEGAHAGDWNWWAAAAAPPAWPGNEARDGCGQSGPWPVRRRTFEKLMSAWTTVLRWRCAAPLSHCTD